jgi:SNF2 family DNA or RNA helicase
MKLIRPRGEQGAMDDVVEVLDSVVDKLDVINPEMSFYLAVRHGRDFRTILWGAIPNEIKSMLNREKLEALMTQKVLETIKKKVTGPAETALRAVPAEPDISPRLLEDVELTQSEIQQLAHEMENVVTSAEAALKDSLQTQAVDFVKRLEEDHFFSQYYSPVPGKALLSEIVRNIDSLLADPALIPISRSALEMIKGEVEEAKGLQDQLHKNGLKKERFLNLYQILGIQKMLTMKKVLLGDEMGLGKTLQTLCAFLMSGKNEMVVVAPRKALGRWLEDIHKHLTPPPTHFSHPLPQIGFLHPKTPRNRCSKYPCHDVA